MLVSIDEVRDMVMMVEPSGRVWIDCDSFVEYLRMIEFRGRDQAAVEYRSGEVMNYAALMAIQDTVRQMADSLVVTSMEARDRMKEGKDESGRRSGRSRSRRGD